jgi:hypothetical protein
VSSDALAGHAALVLVVTAGSIAKAPAPTAISVVVLSGFAVLALLVGLVMAARRSVRFDSYVNALPRRSH